MIIASSRNTRGRNRDYLRVFSVFSAATGMMEDNNKFDKEPYDEMMELIDLHILSIRNIIIEYKSSGVTIIDNDPDKGYTADLQLKLIPQKDDGQKKDKTKDDS